MENQISIIVPINDSELLITVENNKVVGTSLIEDGKPIDIDVVDNFVLCEYPYIRLEKIKTCEWMDCSKLSVCVTSTELTDSGIIKLCESHFQSLPC